jgi:hypothetical protein
MTVRAKETQVLLAIVQPVAVDVIHVQGYRFLGRVQAAVLARVPASRFDQCASQCRRLLAQGSWRSYDEHLVWRSAPRARPALVMSLPREVSGVDGEEPDTSRDVRLRAASLAQSQVAENARKAGRVLHGLGKQLGRVSVVDSHIADDRDEV